MSARPLLCKGQVQCVMKAHSEAILCSYYHTTEHNLWRCAVRATKTKKTQLHALNRVSTAKLTGLNRHSAAQAMMQPKTCAAATTLHTCTNKHAAAAA